MQLSPEERRLIYEEEKARLEAESSNKSSRQNTMPDSSLKMEQNIAAMLCYLGWWITGIIFLILEKKNAFIRFHAAQSLVLFGFITVASWLIRLIPVVGGFLGFITSALGVVLWVVLMVKAYQNENYRIPVASDLADVIVSSMFASEGTIIVTKAVDKAAPTTSITGDKIPTSSRPQIERTGRIVASTLAIVFNLALIVFLNFYNQYIAYYWQESIGGETRWFYEPLINSDFSDWLPVITATLALSIAGHLVIIFWDKHTVREVIELLQDGLAIWAIAMLLVIFPFDFSLIPAAFIADSLPWMIQISLSIVIFILAIVLISRLVKLILSLSKRS
jgi:uncharacterized membrane protein